MVIFDWNGTLLNDVDASYRAGEESFSEFGCTLPSRADFCRKLCEVNGNHREAYKAFCGLDDRAYEAYHNRYMAYAANARLFTEVREILQTLGEQGAFICLVTAQDESIALPKIKQFNIHGFFKHMIFGVGDKEASITELLRICKIKKERAYMVTDGPSDILQTKRVGVKTIAFLRGATPEDILREQNPDFCIANLKALLSILESKKKK